VLGPKNGGKPADSHFAWFNIPSRDGPWLVGVLVQRETEPGKHGYTINGDGMSREQLATILEMAVVFLRRDVRA
jgi:hypothetical protein